MSILNTVYLESSFTNHKELSLFGKWITFENIKPLYTKFPESFNCKQIGSSEKNIPIFSIKLGTGAKKILIWSQMHGNEATGTKALFDLFNCFQHISDGIFSKILEECTLLIIPMLNPDGAMDYSRMNANNIDLNRDAVDLKARESKLLRSILEDFAPEFCFNLHDQRTIFGVEGTKNPATISFLAPSEEETRAITEGRKQTMNVIVAMDQLLQQIIPNHIGRYTDEFYPTATGDNFQKLGHNTILIESGHYPNDYDREEARKYTFFSILQGIYYIADTSDFNNFEGYFEIPNNQKNFFDVIHRYPKQTLDVAYLYEDKIKNGQFISTLNTAKKGDLSSYFGHYEIVFEN